MGEKSNGSKKGSRKKLDNIISKLAEDKLSKTKETASTDVIETVESPLIESSPLIECHSTESALIESSRRSKRKPEKALKTVHIQQNNDFDFGNLTVVKAIDSDEDIDSEGKDDRDSIPLKEQSKSKKKKRRKSEKDACEEANIPKVINCTACNKTILCKTGKLCRHPDLNTLICKKCYKFHNSGKFTKDEYGVEEYCRWCADGGDLICCDFCEKAFCKECIKRNLGKSKLKELLAAGEDEQWNCFCCDPDPISTKILLCNRVMRVFEEKKDQHIPYKDKKGREIIHGPNRSERRNLLTNIGGDTIKTEELSPTSFSKKTYSKRFQGGVTSKSDSEDELINVKKEKKQANQINDATVISSDESEKEFEKPGKANGKTTGGKSKPKKSQNKVTHSDSDVYADDDGNGESKEKKKKSSDKQRDSSDDELINSKKKPKRKVDKIKQSKDKAVASDSDDDFISMVKKSKRGKAKKSSKSRKRALSSDGESGDGNTTSDQEENDSSDKEKTIRKGFRKKHIAALSEEDESTNDDEETPVKTRRRKTKKSLKNKGKWSLRKKRGGSSDDDSNEASDAERPKKSKSSKKKGGGKKKQTKKKRKRINDDDEEEETDENVSPSKKGRKRIRKILDNDKLEAATKHARKLEEERRQRLLERTKNAHFDKPADAEIEQVILEYKSDGETPLVEVDKDLVKHLKPHQVEGVKFMYDCTVESVKSWEKKEEGSGCILAHVMGLGKTLQVVTLVNTMYRSELIELRRVLVVAPLNTVLNWQVEFEKWISVDDRLDVYVLNEAGSKNWNRVDMLKSWHNYGGVLIMGYSMYRNLSQGHHVKNKRQKKVFVECLVDPGPELVVCDEGHILRNCKSAISLAMNTIKTKRRIVLTGTPLQNNLLEYHCMVSFVKPNLLGTAKEFSNSFVHPIQNGQCADSTDNDVRIMKKRCHVLHKMLEGCVQRKDYADIAQFLPPKFEYVIKVRLSEKQRELYKYYLETFLTSEDGNRIGKGGSLFSDYQALLRIWTHPWCLKLETARQIEKFIDSDDSMADFVVESGEESAASSEEMSWTSESSHEENNVVPSSSSSSQESEEEEGEEEDEEGDEEEEDEEDKEEDKEEDDDVKTKKDQKEKKQATDNSLNIKQDPDQPSTSSVVINDEEEISEEKPAVVKDNTDKSGKEKLSGKESGKDVSSGTYGTLRSGQEFKEDVEDVPEEEEWYDKFLTEEDETNVELGSKLVLLLEILADSAALEEKVLVFSHSLISLDLIEKALGGGQIGGNTEDWCRGCDYFRMDGSTSAQMRKRWADIFNEEDNKSARLFLISTKAGGLGINLIGASRVIVFDISWNPSHDVQSIFRAYRFGQKNPVFIYRFIAEGTMEEKIYDRQVTKLSVSQRVVDEHQIQRHFNANDLLELYRFEPDVLANENDERPTPVVPKDPILAELINRLYPKWIVKYHEHDSLLRNRPEEELTEAERKEAWENYEAEKQGIANRAQYMQDGNNAHLINANIMNAMRPGNPTINGVSYGGPSVPVGNPLTIAMNANAQTEQQIHLHRLQLHQQQKRQQQLVLEEQRRRLFEFERQRAEAEKRREEELRKRQEAMRQLEIRRQEERRAQLTRERELEERRRQLERQQFLQQLLRSGNQAAYVTQQTPSSEYPSGQSVYRVVVNPRPPAPRRSPPRIIELPPDA